MNIVGKSEKVLSYQSHKMTGQPYSGGDVTPTQRPLRSLARAISLSRAKFTLILLRCNHGEWQQTTLDSLQKQYEIEPQILTIPESTLNLCHYIEEHSDHNPSALMILGLENVTNLDDLLVSINHNRNEFGRKFSFPLIFWVNDEVLAKMVRLAPDFYSWAGIPIKLVR